MRRLLGLLVVLSLVGGFVLLAPNAPRAEAHTTCTPVGTCTTDCTTPDLTDYDEACLPEESANPEYPQICIPHAEKAYIGEGFPDYVLGIGQLSCVGNHPLYISVTIWWTTGCNPKNSDCAVHLIPLGLLIPGHDKCGSCAFVDAIALAESYSSCKWYWTHVYATRGDPHRYRDWADYGLKFGNGREGC